MWEKTARPSSASYAIGDMVLSMCTLCLVVYSVGVLGFLVGCHCCSSYGVATPFSSFGPFSNSFIRGQKLSTRQGLSMSILVCVFQALAEFLRRHLYQAPVSKHFLASTIVSWFDDSIWVGSTNWAVSGWLVL